MDSFIVAGWLFLKLLRFPTKACMGLSPHSQVGQMGKERLGFPHKLWPQASPHFWFLDTEGQLTCCQFAAYKFLKELKSKT